jgi:hypothetical protein
VCISGFLACQHPPPVHLFIIIIIVIIIVITIKILVIIIIIIVYNPVSANLRRQTVRTDIVPQRENSIFFRLLEVKLPGHNKAPSFGPEKKKYGVVQGRFSLILSTSPHNDETFFFANFAIVFVTGFARCHLLTQPRQCDLQKGSSKVLRLANKTVSSF